MSGSICNFTGPRHRVGEVGDLNGDVVAFSFFPLPGRESTRDRPRKGKGNNVPAPLRCEAIWGLSVDNKAQRVFDRARQVVLLDRGCEVTRVGEQGSIAGGVVPECVAFVSGVPNATSRHRIIKAGWDS